MSSSEMSNDGNKVYERLRKQFPLRPIRDDEHNERAAEICDHTCPDEAGGYLERRHPGGFTEIQKIAGWKPAFVY